MAIAPLLNAAKLLPSSLVVQGLAKLNPKFKNFFTEAASYGYDANRALDYLSQRFGNQGQEQFKNQLQERGENLRPDEKVALGSVNREQLPGKFLRSAGSFAGAGVLGAMGGDSQQEQQQQPEEVPFENVIAKFSPELAKLLDQAFESGHPIDESIQIVQSPNMKFRNVIGHMEQALGMPFYEIVRSVYGGPKQGQTRMATGVYSGAQPSQGAQAPSGNRQGKLAAMLMQHLSKKKG